MRLTETQAVVLDALRQGFVNETAISAETGVPKGSINTALWALKQKGLAGRTQDRWNRWVAVGVEDFDVVDSPRPVGREATVSVVRAKACRCESPIRQLDEEGDASCLRCGRWCR